MSLQSQPESSQLASQGSDERGAALLVEDCAESRRDLKTLFEFLGERVFLATREDCVEVLRRKIDEGERFSLAVLGGSGMGASFGERLKSLEGLAECDATLPFLILYRAREQAEAQHAVEPESLAGKIIARLPMNCGFQPLLDAIHKSQLYSAHSRRLEAGARAHDFRMFRNLVGESESIERVRKMMGQVANTEVSVLITGESGTGKEVVARNLHANSARSRGAFIPINCGAIPRELLESELFGHEKGAFTGAVTARSGRFELAHGGTLFLDEIGDMPLDMQVKLLRVLQERSFERVGGVETLHADVRIVAATHRDLEKMIASGEFRQDLFYRLNVFPIEMPALRERPDDIPLLLNELISTLEREGRGSVRFNSSAIAALSCHSWPGNVRELANLVERMAILHPHGIVGISDLPEKLRSSHESDSAGVDARTRAEAGVRQANPAPSPGGQSGARGGDAEAAEDVKNLANVKNKVEPLPLTGLDLKEYLARLERDLIEKALDDSRGVVTRAADRLSIGRTTLVEKMRKYKLPRLADEQAEESALDERAELTLGSDSRRRLQ